MHILFLSDNFPPEVNAPASRTFEHCREWVKAGHQVTVITCAPNFPAGKIYDGYRNKLWQSEEMSGIRVIRVWSYITANDGFIKRILDYISFMVSAIPAALFVRKVDIVVGTSPQFFTACAACATGALKRVPWVFELRDIWPESIRAVGAMKQSTILNLLEKVELFLYRNASVIVSVTNAFREALIQRGIEAEKIHVVTNGVDISRFLPREKDAELVDTLNLGGKFVAGYIGTHGMAHALDTIIDAAGLLANTPGGEQFCFLMLGDGARKEALVNRVRQENLENIIFVASVPKDQVVRYWSLVDVSIIHLRKTDLFMKVIPSKLFECMAMAIPVLHGVQGESAQIVEQENIGLMFEPQNPQALVAGLQIMKNDTDLYAQFSRNGPLSAKRFDRAVLAGKMLAILSRAKSRF